MLVHERNIHKYVQEEHVVKVEGQRRLEGEKNIKGEKEDTEELTKVECYKCHKLGQF